ncbi:MAG: serine--tRNA ligase, partial [Planctomycetota bacterium]
MLDLRFIRENPDEVRAAVRRRGITVDLDRLLDLDRDLLDLRREREETKAEQNRLSKSVPQLQGDEKIGAIERSKELGRKIKPLEEQIAAREAELGPLQLEVPNMPDPEVPDGLGSEDNREVRRWGEPPEFDFEIKDHLVLGTD